MSKDEDHAQEKAMREAKVPTPKSPQELTDYIEDLVKREHDYGTCVYAMSMAATAAFKYVAHKLGVTGFQASCADLDIIRRTRHIEGPFMIVDGEKALYPQLDPLAEVRDWLSSEDFRKWAAEQAKKKLAEVGSAHPKVIEHWQQLSQTVN